ncbi:MAG TPA: hypothetical protein VJQ53_07390 [Candidatus Eisenbacteria bacterium]|nr:hypothetical protein [Candidatus Eisenbacteria bacterium]
MPVTYALEGSLLKLTLVGTYEPADIIAQFLAALADPKCPDQVALLVDVTRSESLETRAPHEIRQVAEQLGPYRERIGGRCAVVAERDVHFGLSSMGIVYSEGVGVEAAVFRDTKSALEWLRVPAAP